MLRFFIGTHYLLALVLLFTGPLFSQKLSEKPSFERVDGLMEAFLTKTKLPGLSISIAREGQLLYSKGFGFADVERQRPMQPETSIRTASVAKVLTATALGRLISEGKLDIDAPIKNYVSYLESPYANLTVRQLAGHTAGVPHRPKKKKNRRYSNTRERIELMEKGELLFEPDTEYRYSSHAYNLLAAVIEGAAAKSYESFMQEDVFAPLGMTHTKPEVLSALSEQDASAYFFKKDKLTKDTKLVDGSYKLAGAGFRSTSVDLVKMMRAYSNGFIEQPVVQTMFQSHQLKDGQQTQVGLGWRINQDMHGRKTVEHAGSWQGARTVIVHYPAEDVSISIMINAKCVIFIEETAHLIAQFFLEKAWDHPIEQDIDQTIRVSSQVAGETDEFDGRLTFDKARKGQLKMQISSEWIRRSDVYPLAKTSDWILSTTFGFLYLKMDVTPALTGNIHQYQRIGDAFHPMKKAWLRFQPQK
ncbi:MAG: serine hydrolase domain-containing protein [Bacteroidota bacterium]